MCVIYLIVEIVVDPTLNQLSKFIVCVCACVRLRVCMCVRACVCVAESTTFIYETIHHFTQLVYDAVIQ